MQVSRRKEIDRLAEKIRSGLELNRTPFPIKEAVRRLGGEILDGDAAGADAFVRKVGDSFEIQVAPQAYTRWRFSVAHELGHLFLHMGYIIDPARWEKIDEYRDSPKYRYGFTEEEYEAHEFAAALLMPATEFREMVRRHSQAGKTLLTPLANTFEVSTDAARIRGQWLGVFAWNR